MTDNELLQDWILSAVIKLGGVAINVNQDIFFDGGLDSLDFTELLTLLEAEKNMFVDPEVLLSDWTKLRSPSGLAHSLLLIEDHSNVEE